MNSLLNFSFYLYLKSLFNFELNLNNKIKSFKNIINQIDEKKYLDFNFLEYIDDYPKYPEGFRPIINLNKYNILEIYNAYSSSNEFLMASINNSNILNFKLNLDKIPNTNINNDVQIQNIFFEDIYNENLEFNKVIDPIRSTDRYSYIYKMFGYDVPSSEKQTSFYVAYSIYLLLHVNMKSIFNMYNIIQPMAMPYVDVRNISYQKSFEKYINENVDNLSSDIAEFIMSYIYKISTPKGVFFNEIKKIIADILDNDLCIEFKKYISLQDSLLLLNIKNIINSVYSKLTDVILHDLINYSETTNIQEIVNSETNSLFISDENKKLEDRLNRYSENNFKQYAYLAFMYNRVPAKFLNVLQLILKFFTQMELKLVDENDFTENSLQSLFLKMYGTISKPSTSGLNLETIEYMLNNNINKDLLSSIIIDDFSLSYAFRSSMGYYIDEFCNSEVFDKIIDKIIDDVFNYLKTSINITYKYDYYTNKKMLFMFFRSLLRRDIISNKIFFDQENELFELFDVYTNNFSGCNINIESMRLRTIQYVNSNLSRIQNFFENIIFTSLIKNMYDRHISYYLNTNI